MRFREMMIEMGFGKRKRVIDRESDYQKRRYKRELSPDRNDAFANGEKTPDVKARRSYADVMKEELLKRQKEEMVGEIVKKKEEEEKEKNKNKNKKKCQETDTSTGRVVDGTPLKSRRNRWDETPTPGRVGVGVGGGMVSDARPGDKGLVTPTPKRERSRWDQTPMETPAGGVGLATPSRVGVTPELYNLMRWDKDIDERNRPLTDEMKKNRKQNFDIPKELPAGLPCMKPEDYQYFGALLNEEEEEEEELSLERQKERKIMKLLLKIKNGTPPQRKAALRQIPNKAREFGVGRLFDQILPLLMQPTLEDQDRHLLVKVIDRFLYKLDDLVRPFGHKILVVIEPLLIDEDYYACIVGKEIISNLSKAVGLATMIANLRPDMDHVDEYVRNTTAQAFNVVASALGIPNLLRFLKAAC
ncbi:hypothetical protein IFM89_031790 [Coptis chinensis]|uniref:Splicing factor 3B subunit 1 domain-containing protein n=1 Tax=Coptis chinensis TaxID=261450 RepID=A0A835J0Z8_9MAGN|nr:hypothetical protein IFM89_031790 [Coptis chinensis]